MKEIRIENIPINLLSEENNVRIKFDKKDIMLPNQNIDIIANIIEQNFNVVVKYYKSLINSEKMQFDSQDINFISIDIVLHYLYMYNLWRTMYKKQEYKDLRFNEKDLSNPNTHDIVFNYFKTKYPNDWENKCAVLLEMELSELKSYYKAREDFYNK